MAARLKAGVEFVGDIVAGCIRCKTVRYDKSKKKWVCSYSVFGEVKYARFTSKQIQKFLENPKTPSLDIRKLAS